jgi:hypothetical protein
MASDVFVRWKTTKRPTREEAEKVIQDFLGEVATEIEWKKDRFFVTLIGKWSHPLVRVVEPAMQDVIKNMYPKEEGWEGRYLEVWLGDDSLDVMTRRQDEFTHACQDGLAAVFARFWEGEIEK